MKFTISEKVKALPLQDFLEIISRRKPTEGVLDLTLGLPDFDAPQRVKEAAITAIREGKNRYGPLLGLPELQEAICKKLKEKNHISATPQQIIVTGAASGGLALAVMALLNPGDEVIIFDPYFLTYKALVMQTGGIPVVVPTKPDFSLNIFEVKKKITSKTKAILLNTPNNPTGKVYSSEELQELAKIAKEHDLYLIADEVYEDFCYEKIHVSIGSWYEKTITVNSFSKRWAMTGWRIGYIVGPNEVMQEMGKLQLLYYVCAPTPFQYAALTALERLEPLEQSEKPKQSEQLKQSELLEQSQGNFLEEYRRKREIVYEGLKKQYKLIRPEGAFYAFIRYPCTPKKFLNLCQEKKLLVVPGKIFSETDTHFRISFAQKEDILKKAVETLRGIHAIVTN